MILVGIPYHPAKRYALDHVFDWVDKQTGTEVVLRAHLGPYGEHNAIKEQFEFFRTLALDRGADLFIMEADTIPPVDALSRLAAHHKDIVGGLYRYRSDDKPFVAWPKDAIHENTGLCRVDGMGTGCVLLSNKALHEFSFFDWGQPDADYPMYDRLRALGYDVWLDTDIICRHYADKETWT